MKQKIYILSYSGLHNTLAYRLEQLTDLTLQEKYISQGMDASAAVILNGEIIAAAEEERFNGIKHCSDFPIAAINYCLAAANIDISNINYVTHGFNYSPYEDLYNLENYARGFFEQVASNDVQKGWLEKFLPGFPVEKFIPIKHHHAHAASTFYPSPFSEALVVISDGMGEVDSISVFHGKENKLTDLKHYDLFSSLGILYAVITKHLGFYVNSDEYKVMGLAPYGNPTQFEDFFKKYVEFKPKGEIFIRLMLADKTPLEQQTYRGMHQLITKETGIKMVEKDQPLTQEHKDFAAALQKCLEEAMLHIVRYWQEQTKCEYLCLAGGVALNCVSNGKLLQSGLFKDIYVQPASGDAGTSYGSAWYHYYHNLGYPRHISHKQELPLYGPSATSEEIMEALEQFAADITWEKLSEAELFQQAAAVLAEGKVIGWVQDRMEFGPRALGNRSILADPRGVGMRDKVNMLVKKREAFRPFAPSVKLERASDFFDISKEQRLPHMLFVVPVREQYREQLPAITHVDGSARVQTVEKEQHPKYWKLLDAFEKQSGMPILLNTSFNVKGQPIVRTAQEAIATFINANLDALFLDHYMIKRK
jgi:carbamoyltransferase